MQGITHFFSGVFLMKLVFTLVPVDLEWAGYLLLFPLGVLLHFVIDALAKITYHPPDALTHDKFWITWHAIVLVGSVIVAIWFWTPYFWGMFAAILPDIYDWGLIRGVRAYRRKKRGNVSSDDTPFMEGKEFHPWVDKFREKFLAWLPDWNHERKGIIPEILIWIGCIVAVYLYT